MSPSIRKRLVEKLVDSVQDTCAEAGVKVTRATIRKELEQAIDSYVERNTLALGDDDDWAPFVEGNYPKYDLSKGGDQGRSGEHSRIHAAYVAEKRLETMGWYYERNGGTEIESTCSDALILRMKAAQRPASSRRTPKAK